MNVFLRLLIGSLVFAGIFALGWFVFGIQPTFTEVLLCVFASSFANGVEEGLK